ncbi:MAG: Hsp20/alpha crystallin family protein, partial [Mobilitalea sp.]
MLLPSIFENNFVDSLFDDMFSFPFTFNMPSAQLMHTDVQDLGDNYQLEIELPGYEKKDVHAQLEKGYLTITAEKQETKEENDENGKYVRKERYRGSCKRSFYVGENLKEEDFHATFDNGIMKLV